MSCGWAKDAETPEGPQGSAWPAGSPPGFEQVNKQNEEQFNFSQVVFTLQQNDTLHLENSFVNVSSLASSFYDWSRFHRSNQYQKWGTFLLFNLRYTTDVSWALLFSGFRLTWIWSDLTLIRKIFSLKTGLSACRAVWEAPSAGVYFICVVLLRLPKEKIKPSAPWLHSPHGLHSCVCCSGEIAQ